MRYLLFATLLLGALTLMAPGCRSKATTIVIRPESAAGQAMARAKVSGKPVLLHFTGSDWCTWCITFDQETLNQPAFREYAGKSLEVVTADFPMKTELPADVRADNDALQIKYGVEGYPTFVLINADGKVLGRIDGYLAGGPATFIARLDSFRAKTAM